MNIGINMTWLHHGSKIEDRNQWMLANIGNTKSFLLPCSNLPDCVKLLLFLTSASVPALNVWYWWKYGSSQWHNYSSSGLCWRAPSTTPWMLWIVWCPGMYGHRIYAGEKTLKMSNNFSEPQNLKIFIKRSKDVLFILILMVLVIFINEMKIL